MESYKNSTTSGQALPNIEDYILEKFGPYEVMFKFDEDARSVKIIEVRVNKDFRDTLRQAGQTGYASVEKFYE